MHGVFLQPERQLREGLVEIDATGRLERILARLLLRVYKRRLRGLVEVAPAC